MVQAMLAVVCSPDSEGVRAGAALALSTVVLGTLARANGARLFAIFFDFIDEETLASPGALDVVEMNAPKSEELYNCFGGSGGRAAFK
ncbi:hypothetical protein N7467_005461 [Penicillium canescens]|nr:hypothetical protein N7467_005461 [Penicillium canescens]